LAATVLILGTTILSSSQQSGIHLALSERPGGDCSGCGEQGWGWNDNGYGYLAEPIYFATAGPQTIRVLRREDGISINQVVLSAGRFLNSAPGAAKNDTTIVPK
jgi:hypothetical protein